MRASWIARLHRLGLAERRMRPRMPAGIAALVARHAALEHIDDVPVLRVDEHECARAGSMEHRREQRLVVDADRT